MKPSETAKYLGIILDSQMKFDNHILKSLTKILRSIGIMSKIEIGKLMYLILLKIISF